MDKTECGGVRPLPPCVVNKIGMCWICVCMVLVDIFPIYPYILSLSPISPYIPLYPSISLYRSEGIPLRDISSLGAMDWGLARLENSSAAVAGAAAVVALWMEGDDL